MGRRDQEPLAVSADRSVVIGYDDAESVAIKTEWAMNKGLRGVFFWQIAADRLPDGTNPLQEAARKKWDERQAEAVIHAVEPDLSLEARDLS